MNTKQLRQKILDLAIRGKLVPQDPNDEPASVLLERIRTEKEQLIKEGKIKREKKDNAIICGVDKSHYEQLPQGWVWTFLGDVFNLQAGKFVQATDIVVDNAVHKFPCYGGNGLRGYVSTFNREGEYPIIGRQGALCGNLNYASGKFYATEHAVVVDCFSDTNQRWAFFFLDKLNLNQYATATAQPGLSVKTINEVLIPLPPIAEQCRIVAAIESTFAVIDEIERSKTDLQSAVVSAKSKVLSLAIQGKLVSQDPNDEPASVLLERIRTEREALIKTGKIKRNKADSAVIRSDDNSYYENLPSGWVIAYLDDVADVFDYLRQPINAAERNARIKGKLQTDLYPYFGATGQVGYIDDYIFDGDYVLLGEDGAPFLDKNTDKAYLISGKTWVNNHAHILKAKINMKYLCYVLNSVDYKSYVNGTTRLKLTQTDMNRIVIPLPPFVEQQRIVMAIEATFEQLEQINQSLN
ncbi:MAG: restriction endonuclease subunit S [Nitrososphaerota archaeon]|nr:restriction endonuclease subunit S [Nitrososphaerota archaeon]